MKRFKWVCGILVICQMICGINTVMAFEEESSMNVSNLRCEYLENPLGLDMEKPRFGWICESNERGQKQTAYQIIVASDSDKLNNNTGDIWDSGKVVSKSNQVEFDGESLESNKKYYWKMRVWDKDDAVSEYSETSFFTTGIFNADEWTAQWIGRENEGTSLPVFAKSFIAEKDVARATVFASAPSMFELHINGEKVSDNLFEPGESNYDKKVFYVSYDVTDFIRNGENAVGAYIGKGFYYNPAITGRFNRSAKVWGDLMFLCQLEIEYSDGEKTVIGTDETWSVTDGPITESCWLGGEDYDARLEKDGFDKPGYDYSAWENAAVKTELPFSYIESRKYPPLRAVEEVEPVEVKKLSNGDCVVDFGKNFAGVYKITAQAPAGTKVTVYPSENINSDGSVNQSSTVFSGAKIFDTYTFKGNGEESYTPKFVYHGARYLQISGLDVTGDMVSGYIVHCDNEPAGSITTSDEELNKADTIINRSISDNMYNVVTDCPHREKLGWLEVPNLLFNTIADNYNVAAYMQKISDDMLDAQKTAGENAGSVPSIVPPFTVGIREHALRSGPDDTPNDPAWCGSVIMVPWNSYVYYGNIRQLEDAYDGMEAYFVYLTKLANSKSNPYLLDSAELNRDLGDWVSIEKTDVTLVTTCTYYQLANVMGKASEVLGKTDKSAEYKALAQNIKDAVNSSFLDEAAMSYDTGTQTANAYPLFLDIVPDEYRDGVLQSLVNDVIKHDYHLTTGETGMRPLLNVLSDNGYEELAYRMISADTEPGYKYFVKLGKTSLPEMWDGSSSQNHCILGHGDGWLYEYLAGIRNNGTAYDKIVIDPYIPIDIRNASGSVKTQYGEVHNSWKKNGKTVEMKTTVPVGSAAEVHIPTTDISRIRENGNAVSEGDGIKEIHTNDNETIITVLSGSYEFTFPRTSTDTDIEIISDSVDITGGKIDGTITLKNHSENTVNVNVYTALYNGDGALSQTSKANHDVSAGSQKEVDISIEQEGIEIGDKVKILVWNDGMEPLCGNLEYDARLIHVDIPEYIDIRTAGEKTITLSGADASALRDGGTSVLYGSNSGVGDYVGIDFGEKVKLSKMTLSFGAWRDLARMDGCEIQYKSDDSAEWTKVCSMPQDYGGMDDLASNFDVDFGTTIECSAIRLIRTESNDYASWVSTPDGIYLYEMKVYKKSTDEDIVPDRLGLVKK